MSDWLMSLKLGATLVVTLSFGTTQWFFHSDPQPERTQIDFIQW